MNARVSDVPNPKTFKKPATWATYCSARSTKFKMHQTLGMCKTAIGGLPYQNKTRRTHPDNNQRHEYALAGDVWIYQFDPDLDEWVEIAHLPAGSFRFDHHLWKTSQKSERKIKPVSEQALQAAIDSIKSVGRE